MQKIFTFIALCNISLLGFSQKVDLDRFYFTAAYRSLPREPLDTSFHTFTVKVEMGPLSKLALRKTVLEDQVQFAGWRQLKYNGHIQVQFRMEDVLIEKSEVKESVEVLKDKNGKETGRKSNYELQITYSFGAYARIVDHTGRQLADYTIATRENKRIYRSEAFQSAAEANAYFRFGVVAITNLLIQQSAEYALNVLNNTLTTNHGYAECIANDFFWVLDSRRHPEYENHRRAWINFKQAITGMSADESLDRVKKELQPVIDYFNSVKKKYSSGSKADKKLRYASYYNLAKIYLYLDNPDEAMQQANELVINGFDSKDGRYLETVAADLKIQLRLAKRNSRHFPLNVEEYQGVVGGQ